MICQVRHITGIGKAGYRSYAEAERELLNNGGFAPTQMDAQNSIQRKRTGAVRLQSDKTVNHRTKNIKND